VQIEYDAAKDEANLDSMAFRWATPS